MATQQTLIINYGLSLKSECSGVLFEIPDTNVKGGDILPIRLWGYSYDLLLPYTLWQGTNTMGVGTLKEVPDYPVTEDLVFDGHVGKHTNWIIDNVSSITAKTNITKEDTNGNPVAYASAGQDIMSRFDWNGNLLVESNGAILTGTVTIVYNSTLTRVELIDFAETFKYQAKYPIDTIESIVAVSEICIINNDGEIESWAIPGDDITNKFDKLRYSCIIQSDKIPLYGSVKFTYKQSPYMKYWEWTIPVGVEGLYWFFLKKNGIVEHKFSIKLPDLTDGSPELRNIALYIYARESEVPVPFASVWIDNVYVGKTDSTGYVYVDNILTGKHTIKAKAPGFIDTDMDNLYNDEINIY